MKAQLQKALKQQQIITIIYIAKNGVITKRCVKVLKLTHDTFQAYCFTRKAKRTFSIENILAIIPVVKFERKVI